jgi:Glycosyltransferase family 87
LAWRQTAVLAGGLHALVCLLAPDGLLSGSQDGDVDLYATFGRRLLDGELPYRDFSVEYPPGALPLFALPALVESHYGTIFKLLMVGCGLVTIGAVAWILAFLGAGRVRTLIGLGSIVIAPLLLGEVYLSRYDPYVAMIVALALALLLAGRRRLGAGLLGVAFATKVFAVAVAPVVAVLARRRGDFRQAVLAFALGACVFIVPTALLAFDGFAESVDAQLGRRLHVESLGGSLLLAADRLRLYDATLTAGTSLDLTGSFAGVTGTVTSLLGVIAIGVIALAYARGPDTDERLVLAFAACVTAFVVCSKVLSPQFLTWLIPLVPLVAGRTGRVSAALLLAALPLTQVELRGYVGLEFLEWGVWTLLARNVLLVTILALLVRRLASRELD